MSKKSDAVAFNCSTRNGQQGFTLVQFGAAVFKLRSVKFQV